MSVKEFNFDGLIGPTHNYAGLSFGNVASAAHQHQPSSPRTAALQGLEKMKFMASLGLGQCVLPPLDRPCFRFLRELGFSGSENQLIDKAHAHDPSLLAACYSASSMWTANAGTVSPSIDCDDGRLHITPANLSSTLHRSIEHPSTTKNLRSIFADESRFVVHAPLPSQPALADEGAANHTRLCTSHSDEGIELFVYGSGRESKIKPKKFPARQTLLASQSVARQHQLSKEDAIFLPQDPDASDAGVFHNDVIAVGNENVLLCHELAFVNQNLQLQSLADAFHNRFEQLLWIVEFSQNEIDISDAVSSYLFNSQLVTKPDGNMALICPTNCRENPSAYQCTQRLLQEENPIDQIEFFDLNQSMNNGGGPACLRLRVVLSQAEQSAIHQGVVLTDELYDKLVAWVNANYREQIVPDDLRDPKLVDETRTAMDQLSKILGFR
ncbi:MAG: N-succinylarginine dihydrolase [Mariniblastus sp.]